MVTRSLSIAFAALISVTTAAAHAAKPVSCTRTLNLASRVDVSSYPAFVLVDVTIFNNDTAATVTLTQLQEWPFQTQPVPFVHDLPPGTSTGGTFPLTINSYEQCAALAGEDPDDIAEREPVELKTFTKVWSTVGTAKCRATLVCH
jgi:hypothetical protein